MEIEPNPQQVANKIWNIFRILFFMAKKTMSKGTIDIQFLFRRGKLAGKAITNLLFHHHHRHHLLSTLSCKSSGVSFISPREYEFSCSNSPAVNYPFYPHNRRKRHHKSSRFDDVTTVAAVHKVFEMLSGDAAEAEAASPVVALPGFGRSPVGRELRVTDSPFPLKDDGDSRVDLAAEEFIKKFYKDLKLQKRMTAMESPAHRNIWGRR